MVGGSTGTSVMTMVWVMVAEPATLVAVTVITLVPVVTHVKEMPLWVSPLTSVTAVCPVASQTKVTGNVAVMGQAVAVKA